MTASSPSPHWQRLAPSSLIDVLKADEDIEDVRALCGQETPRWLRRLTVPMDWQLIDVANGADQTLTRMAVRGPRGGGEWEAAQTISVYGYTGWPTFYDVFHNADGTLRALNATHITVNVLAVPPIQRVAAVRSRGTVAIGDRSVWVEQSNFVTGSEHPHASRLIVHNLFVENSCHAGLAEDLSELSDAVYRGFVAALPTEHHTG